jgi:alkyl hydroperoxide reductase subunit D
MTVHDIALAKTAAFSSVDALRDALPDFAKDIRLNLPGVLKEDPASTLTLAQVFGTALAAAYATRHHGVVSAIAGDAQAHLSPEEVNAAKAAATVMAMNNIYYRSVHMLHDDEIGKMPAGLRMNVIGNPGIDKATFELYELAVSAINGCGGCIQAHASGIAHANLPKAAVQHVFRIAAVVNAAAQALSI